MLQQIKTPADVAAVGTGLAAFFQMIPWADMAGFLSVVYLLIRIYFVLKNKGQDNAE